MMNNIITNQNKRENLKKLAAQRQLYKEAKQYFLLQVLLTVPVTVALSILKLVPEDILGFNATYVAAFFGVLITIGDLLIGNFIVSDFRAKAAKIQEQFDCDVYEMEWNKSFMSNKIPVETINKYAQKYITKPHSPLGDWYPVEVKDYSREKAIYTCQKTNLHYDRTLRNKFIRTTVTICVSTLLLIVLVSLVKGLTFRNFFVQVLLPFMPILVLTLKIVFDHSKSIKTANELHGIITNITDKQMTPAIDVLEDIQKRIYLNRKDSPLVPDFFYKKKREILEDKMHQNAAE